MRRRATVLVVMVGLVAVAATVPAAMGLAGPEGGGTWESIAHLVQPRTGGALVTLADGRAVLLGGVARIGPNDAEMARIVELWQPTVDAIATEDRDDPAYPWSPIAFQAMGFATSAVRLGDDLVLAIDDSASAEIGTWLVSAGDGLERRPEVTAQAPARFAAGRGMQDEPRPPALVAIGPGRAVLVGSPEYGVQQFDVTGPSGGSWTATPPMNHARKGMAVAALPDGRVLAAGGLVPEMAETPGFAPTGDDALDTMLTLRTAEIRDPATGAWTDVATMPYPVLGAVAVTLEDGRVLLANGWTEIAATSESKPADPLLYDPASDTWTATAPPPVAAAGARLVALLDGSAMLVGGDAPDDRNGEAFRWDPVTGTWSPAGSMAVRREELGAAVLDDGRVIVAGGRDERSMDTPVVEIWQASGTGG